MKKYRLLSVLLMIILSLTCFTGCEEDDGSGHTFKMNLAANPENLDPQMATDLPSRIVIRNMMSGLVRINETGAIEADAAENYTVSEDGLIYTFYLKKNVMWEAVNGYKAVMTADDFVFAFQRIFDPEALHSPYIERFSSIKNSSSVATGSMPADKLGVKAIDDNTLVIELEYPCYNFLEMLTTTAAMPCNRAFFESTKGKYGLDDEATISNGAFYLKEWNYDPYWDNNYIIMRRNKLNSERDYAYPYSLNFFIKDSENDAGDFDTGSIDCIMTNKYDTKLLSKNGNVSYSTESYGLVFNVTSPYFKSKNLRSALASAFNREMYANVLAPNFSVAYGIIPGSVTVLGKNYRSLSADTAFSLYDKYEAARMWKRELESLNQVSLDNIKITVPEALEDANYLDYITEQWQQNLGFYCGIEVVSQNEYELKLSENSFDIALVQLNAESSAEEYFELFINGEKELEGYVDYAAKGSLYGVQRAESLSKAVELYTAAEKLVIDSAVYIPLFYGNEYFVYTPEAQDIGYRPFTKEIDFHYAKYFD